MAVLSNPDRVIVWERIMRDRIPSEAMNKTQLRAVVNAVDQWCDDNASSYNSAFNGALPGGMGATISATLKALVLAFIVLRRAGR